jgi:hypothetical protein
MGVQARIDGRRAKGFKSLPRTTGLV